MGTMINIIRDECKQMDIRAMPCLGREFHVKNEHVEMLAREVIEFTKPIHSPCEVILCKSKEGRKILERYEKEIREYTHKQILIDTGCADEVLKGSKIFGLDIVIRDNWKEWNRR